MGCESYCSKHQECWGCSVDCSTADNCQWNAIPECGAFQNWTGLIKGDVSQKPGIRYITPFFIILEKLKYQILYSHDMK